MLPLITDAVDYGKSLVVGDGKQSIYRWRAGEVEQFLQLPTIFKGEKLIFKQDWENKLKAHEENKILEKNFRSRKEIIKFNNDFFEQLKTLLTPHLQDIYKEQKQEFEYAKEGGMYIWNSLAIREMISKI